MTAWLRFVVVALLLAGSVAGPRVAAAQTADAAQARESAPIVQALRAWTEAFNSRDPKRITALYAPDAVFWGTTAKTIAATPDAVFAYFKDAGLRPNTRVTIESAHVRVYGEIAIDSGAYTFAEVQDGVTSNVRPARFTFVFRRVGDRWLIVDHHSSRVPEP
jgi:uncharacterized protein (TIGR02246 family)